MIDLTPLEVRQKKGDFRRVMRGYDPELVDDFLDLAADRLEELVKENMTLRESVEAVQAEVVVYRQKEQALSDALMTAQQLREEARKQAEKEGELVLREARVAAQAAREEAARQIVREEETLRQVRARRGQMVESFRRLLERELSQLAVIEESLELGASRSAAARERAAGPPSTAGRAKEEGTGPASRKSSGGAAASAAAKRESGAGAASADRTESKEGSEAAKRGGRSGAPKAQEDPEVESDGESDGAQEDWLSSLIEEP
jgi:cell division initiation protein